MNTDDRLRDAAKRTNSSLAGAAIPPLRERRPSRWVSATLAATMVVVVVGAAALLNRGTSVVPTPIPIAPGTTSTTQPTTTVTGATTTTSEIASIRRGAVLRAIDSVLGVHVVFNARAADTPAQLGSTRDWQGVVAETSGGSVVSVSTQLRASDPSIGTMLDQEFAKETWDHGTDAWVHTSSGTRSDGNGYVASIEVVFENQRFVGTVILEDPELVHEDGTAWDEDASWVPVSAVIPISDGDAVAIAKQINDALWNLGFGADQPETTSTTVPVAGLLPPLAGWQDSGADPAVFGDVTITGAVSLGDTIVVTGCATNDGAAGGFPVWTSTDGATWEQASGPPSVGYFELDCADNLTATPFGLYATAGALLHSEDGRTWEAVSLPTPQPDGVTGSIFVADAVFPTDNRVTLLLSTAGESESRWDVIYTTTDGSTWTEGPAESARLFDSSDVSDVLVTSGGLIAVGASPGGEFVPTAAVWTSADGLNWQKVTDAGTEFAEASMNAVIETESGFVAVGGSSATGLIAAWTSPEGITWHRQPGSTEHVDADVAYMTATSITEVGGALYATGYDFDARRPDASQAVAALWMSSDGATWERLLFPSTAIPFNIVGYGSDSIGFWPPPRWGAIAPVQVLKRD